MDGGEFLWARKKTERMVTDSCTSLYQSCRAQRGHADSLKVQAIQMQIRNKHTSHLIDKSGSGQAVGAGDV